MQSNILSENLAIQRERERERERERMLTVTYIRDVIGISMTLFVAKIENPFFATLRLFRTCQKNEIASDINYQLHQSQLKR